MIKWLSYLISCDRNILLEKILMEVFRILGNIFFNNLTFKRGLIFQFLITKMGVLFIKNVLELKGRETLLCRLYVLI